MSQKIYQALAHKIQAVEFCEKENNKEWLEKHLFLIDHIMKQSPSGSGIDSGTKLLLEESHGEKLVFLVKFHHMNGDGFYVAWTSHKVIVTPSLLWGFNLRITGRNLYDIKEYLHKVYSNWLQESYSRDHETQLLKDM